MTLHFLNDVTNVAESTQTSMIASLKGESMDKLINRIPGSRLLISSLPGSASRTHVDSLGKPRDSTSVLKALPGKLDIKYSLSEPWHEISNNMVYATSKGSDQPALTRRLIRAFASPLTIL